MKKMILACAALVLSSVAHADIDLSNMAQAAAAFDSGRKPVALEIKNTVWAVTSIASKGSLHGLYPEGVIEEQGREVRQTASFRTLYSRAGTYWVSAIIRKTDINTGSELSRATPSGRLSKVGAKLSSSGSATTCATLFVCRLIADKHLVCAQKNDDHRPMCAGRGSAISSYFGYSRIQ